MSIDLTLVGQFIIFITMLLLLKKMLYVPLNDAMEARAKKIEDGLAAADAGLEARAKADADAEAQIDAAKFKAQEIIAAADKRATEVKEEAVQKARVEAAGIVDAGKEELASEVNRAQQALREEVADIAILAAERIVGEELDAKKHAKLIDSVVKQGFNAA
ncbi:MAG: F0F1 ATP synthase subunit B [Mariprofundaceae bacterium]|nr:F0F1 ATP synthase subunit B [Mariprofundaceae bacterium]